jgi:hypothetical protein
VAKKGRGRVGAGSPSWTKGRTFRVVFEFLDSEEEKGVQPKPLRIYRNPIFIARKWKKALEDGIYTSQADLARKVGISRARVTQILRLLKLAPEVQKVVAALGDPLPSPIITERRLRSVINLPVKEQKGKVEEILRAALSLDKLTRI